MIFFIYTLECKACFGRYYLEVQFKLFLIEIVIFIEVIIWLSFELGKLLTIRNFGA